MTFAIDIDRENVPQNVGLTFDPYFDTLMFMYSHLAEGSTNQNAMILV